ncbi:DEAD/DEAH box helicase, partial [Thauera aminoaromatica S2]
GFSRDGHPSRSERSHDDRRSRG